jgi:pimeloyl-ACP methyl ester carboxylesterase
MGRTGIPTAAHRAGTVVTMPSRQQHAVDEFRLAYDRVGTGDPVVLLHGWPGDRHDYRDVIARLDGDVDLVVPDLRGFGASDKHDVDPGEHYDAAAQARSVVALLSELGIDDALWCGYDVGSRVAQAVARLHPERVRGLVLSPPLPGVGDRILNPDAQGEFWYQALHQLPLVEQILDGRPDAIRAYLAYFWNHWSGPEYQPDDDELDRLATAYGQPGAFVASIDYYRAGAGTVSQSRTETAPDPDGRISAPTIVLWPGADPLFRTEWADRLGEFFSDVTVRIVDGGHFTPLEAPGEFAAAIRDAIGAPRPL